MRIARLVESGEAYYHCVSRVVQRQRLLDDKAKREFQHILRNYESFCGIRVITYAVMSDHFHLLLEVPQPTSISDREFFARLSKIYSKEAVIKLKDWLNYLKKHGMAANAKVEKERYVKRMFDLSQFVKVIKQRFTQWFNSRNSRRGTLWEERFKSVVVEPAEEALSMIAAYIDLNGVRAELVGDPRDYPFCGYAEAVAGSELARKAYKTMLKSLPDDANWRTVNRAYRKNLEVGNRGQTVDIHHIRQVLDEGGELSRAELLRCRLRYLTDGAVIGSKDFVDDIFKRHRKRFGLKRKDGGRVMRGGDFGALHSMRDLRLDPISPPNEQSRKAAAPKTFPKNNEAEKVIP